MFIFIIFEDTRSCTDFLNFIQNQVINIISFKTSTFSMSTDTSIAFFILRLNNQWYWYCFLNPVHYLNHYNWVKNHYCISSLIIRKKVCREKSKLKVNVLFLPMNTPEWPVWHFWMQIYTHTTFSLILRDTMLPLHPLCTCS